MKNKIYLILYYLISVTIIFISIHNIYFSDMYEFTNNPNISFIFIIISIILSITVTAKLIINKNIHITNKDIIFITIYLIFLIIIIISCLIFDKKLLIPHIEYHYYTTITLIPYILLNTNTLKKKKKRITNK